MGRLGHSGSRRPITVRLNEPCFTLVAAQRIDYSRHIGCGWCPAWSQFQALMPELAPKTRQIGWHGPCKQPLCNFTHPSRRVFQ